MPPPIAGSAACEVLSAGRAVSRANSAFSASLQFCITLAVVQQPLQVLDDIVRWPVCSERGRYGNREHESEPCAERGNLRIEQLLPHRFWHQEAQRIEVLSRHDQYVGLLCGRRTGIENALRMKILDGQGEKSPFFTRHGSKGRYMAMINGG